MCEDYESCSFNCLNYRTDCAQAVQSACELYTTTMDWEVTGVFQNAAWYLGLVLISALGYGALTIAIYFNPSLQVHPMQLVMAISLVGGSTCFAFFFGSEVCQFGLYKLMSFTLFLKWNDPYSNFYAALILWASVVFLSVFLLNAMLWLNIFMAVDLINTIKYPFRPKSTTFYFIFTFVSSFIVAALNWIGYHSYYQWRDRLLSIWLVITSVIYLVTAATSIIYAQRKLRKPGISQEVREIVYRRHVLSIAGFVLAYSYFFVSAAINWKKQGNGQLDIHSWLLALLKIIFGLQGLIIPMTRFAEPAFLKLIKRSFKEVIFYFVFKRPE